MEYNYKCPKCKNKFMVEKKISEYNKMSSVISSALDCGKPQNT